MTDPSKAFHGFAVPDTGVARAFYSDVLGIEVTEENDILRLQLGGAHAHDRLPEARPRARDLHGAQLPGSRRRGRRRRASPPGAWIFERYEGTPIETDEKGVFRGGGPLIAWFTDPAGNIFSIIAED